MRTKLRNSRLENVNLAGSDLSGAELQSVIWKNVGTCEQACLNGHTGKVYTLAYSPDSKFLASGSDTTILIWESSTGKEVKIKEIEGYPKDFKFSMTIAFSPNSKYLAFEYTNSICIWDFSTGKEVKQLEGHELLVTSVAYSPSGELLASGSWD